MEKQVKVYICATAKDSKNTRGKINIPKKMLNILGINEEDNLVNIKLDEKKKQLIIKKVD